MNHCSTTFQWTSVDRRWFFHIAWKFWSSLPVKRKNGVVGGVVIRDPDEEMKRWRDEDVGKSPLTKAQSFIINDCFYCVIPFNSGRRVLVKRRCVIWRWFKSLWKEWLSTPKCNGLSLPSFAILVELQVTEMFPNQQAMMFFLEPSWLTLVTVKYIMIYIIWFRTTHMFIIFYSCISTSPLIQNHLWCHFI